MLRHNKGLRVAVIVAAALAAAGGILWTVSAAVAHAGGLRIAAGVVFSAMAAMVVARVLIEPRKTQGKKINAAALLSPGGIITLLFLAQGVLLVVSALDDVTVLMPGLLYCTVGALGIGQLLGGGLFRQRGLHDEDTLRAWEELERKGSEANGRRVLACPRCKELVYEDEEVCSHCGNIFLNNYTQPEPKRNRRKK